MLDILWVELLNVKKYHYKKITEYEIMLSRIIGTFQKAEEYEKTKDRQKFIDALIWCSGSDDFQVGGKARKGWEKICLPLLKDEK